MTWYKMDIWYQYMAGSSMFYHEQGFDEFWRPGGTAAAGIRPVQLSPKGKLVDRFLRADGRRAGPRRIRSRPWPSWWTTPTAGSRRRSGPTPSRTGTSSPDRFRCGDHEQMLEEYFWTAYHPIGPESEKPMTGTNEVYVPGVFGDIFDVIYAYPDVARWRTIDTYPVVIAAGEIELTAAEGQRLAQYVERGGTLLVADAHLTGPGLAALGPAGRRRPPRRPTAYRGSDDASGAVPRSCFRYRPITRGRGGRVLATTPDGKLLLRGLGPRPGAADLPGGAARPGHRPPGRAGGAPADGPPDPGPDAGRGAAARWSGWSTAPRAAGR